MNMGAQWSEDWRDDASTAAEQRAEVMDDLPVFHDPDVPGGLWDLNDYRAWCAANEPKEASL